jgi:hypothetical protein
LLVDGAQGIVMKRTHLTLVVVAGLAGLGFTACASNVTGTGERTGTTSNVAPTSTSTSASQSASDSASASTSGSSAQTSAAAPKTSATHAPPVTTTKAPIATPSPLPVFNDLRLSYKACAPVVSQLPTDISLIWSVVNATGIAVGIDDTNFADATQYKKASGNMVITSGSCIDGQKHTYDVWTLGGTGGKQAHKQLTYSAPQS